MAAKRRRRRRAAEECVCYALEVQAWDHYYSWSGVAESRWEKAGYRHLETLTFKGTVVRPEGFRYPNGQVVFSAHARLREETFIGRQPTLGSLNASGDEWEAYAFVPEEHMPQLVAVAASGRVKYVLVDGSRMKWRHGTIESVRVRTELDPDEL